MDELILDYKNMGNFISALMKEYDVIAPVEKDNRYIFDRVDIPSKIVCRYDTTLLPPVKWLYPDNEPLFRFNVHDMSEADLPASASKQVFLFLHPCDINAINIMDEILAEEPADTSYLLRRQSAIIIAYECLAPCRSNILCFDKGYHKIDKGYDLMFTEIGRRFYVHVATDRGMAIADHSDYFRKAGYDDRAEVRGLRKEGAKGFRKAVKGDMGMLSHLLKENYYNEIWDIEGKRCLSCGACNMVCPTCYCFDVVDEVEADMESGLRYRKWDGCQLAGFCKIASGENFRGSAAERLRHRVFKKEVYLKKRFGRSGCVGCGRCIDSCIAGISIIDIFNHIMETRRDGFEVA